MTFSIDQEHYLVSEDSQIMKMPATKNKALFKSGFPDSIIIHYTAGSSAKSSAEYLQQSGVMASAHVVIGRDGSIYQLVPLNTIAWHAGESFYDDRSHWNDFSIGIELDNAGVLTPIGEHRYQSVFKKIYPENEVLFATHRNETMPRYWHTYTDIQIEICMSICLAIMEKRMNTRKPLAYLLGHEEISPGRKIDPGPAFPLEIFRKRLLFNDRKNDALEPLPEKGIVASPKLNIRAGAGTEFPLIALPLPAGKEMTILGENEGWFEVETSIRGWVKKDFVNPKSV